MRSSTSQEKREVLRDDARQWFAQRISRYLDRLADNFQRRAQSATEPQKTSLLLQYNLIQARRNSAEMAFEEYINHSLRQSRPYQRGTHPQLDHLARLLEKAESKSNTPSDQRQNSHLGPSQNATTNDQGLCRAISPMSVFAGFQQINTALQLQDSHYNQSLSLFNVLLLNELEKLYKLLSQRLTEAGVSDQRGCWINHIEQQLKQQNLSAQQRALAEKRLQHLMPSHDSSQTRDDISDEHLLAQVQAVFQNVTTNKSLPPGLLACFNALQTQLSNIAMHERSLFMNPLHPARQVCRQLVATVQNWPMASQDCRQQFEADLKQLSQGILQQGPGSQSFASHQALVDQHCQRFNRRIQLSDQLRQQKQTGQEGISRLRSQIHRVLDQKIAGEILPKSVEDMLYGPWSTVVLYHWVRHGSDGEATKRCLNFVDDVLWYIKPHTEWADLRRAKTMSADIETQLLAGMRRVNVDQHEARTLLRDLHQRRLNALATGSSTEKSQLRS